MGTLTVAPLVSTNPTATVGGTATCRHRMKTATPITTKEKIGKTRMRNSRQRCATGVGMGGSESMLEFRFVFGHHACYARNSSDLFQFSQQIFDAIGIAQQQ